jgi:hypothetical protein
MWLNKESTAHPFRTAPPKPIWRDTIDKRITQMSDMRVLTLWDHMTAGQCSRC